MIKRLFLIVFSFYIFMPLAFSQTEEKTYGIHTVEQGETLYRISRNYYLSVKDITDINPGLTPQTLKAGQTIKIPYTVRNKSLLKHSDVSTVITSYESPVLYQNPSQREEEPQPKNNKKDYSSKKKLNIAMILPMAYDKIPDLDFNKFNIEEKKRKKYHCFEYITFYEGARIALDKLEKQGYAVSLYVYDIGEEDTKAMQDLIKAESLKNMDLIIPLVFQKNFTLVMEYANKNSIPIINPMSQNVSILKDNPYLFKIQPSPASEVETTIRYIRNNFKNPNVTLLYTPNASEKPIMEYYKLLFEKGGMTWCIIDYNRFSSRIFEKVDNTKDNIFISIVDKGNPKFNEAYANELLSKLNANKRLPEISLIAQASWLDYPSIDLALIDKFNFHFTLSYLNDYTNKNFVEFVKEYRKHFKAEPDKIYAAMGYDIMMYFVPVMIMKGNDFIDEPNYDNTKEMINPFYFLRNEKNNGYQNKRTVIYKVEDYKIISVGR